MTGLFESLIITAADVYEPHSGYGLAGLAIIGAPAMITAAGMVWVVIRQRRNEGKVKEVKEKLDKVGLGVKATTDQVVNGHANADPLRADVDKLLKMAEDNIAAVSKVHTAVTAEKEARRTAIDGINDRLGGIEEHLRKR